MGAVPAVRAPLPVLAACGTIHRRRPPPRSLAIRTYTICVRL